MKYLFLAAALAVCTFVVLRLEFGKSGGVVSHSPEVAGHSRPSEGSSARQEQVHRVAEAMRTAAPPARPKPVLTAPLVPVPDTPSPLQEIMLNGRSKAKRRAEDLRRYLRLSAETAVMTCWKTIPAEPVRLQFVVGVKSAGVSAIEVDGFRLETIIGDFAPQAGEQKCLEDQLARVTSAPDAEMTIAALGELALTERLEVDWPCSTCTP